LDVADAAEKSLSLHVHSNLTRDPVLGPKPAQVTIRDDRGDVSRAQWIDALGRDQAAEAVKTPAHQRGRRLLDRVKKMLYDQQSPREHNP